MRHRFYCEACEISFADEGIRQEWHDPVYGAAWKLVAECLSCGHMVSEMKDALKSKSSHTTNAGNSDCATGTCPFVRN